jgi:ankyrin repeat protein
MPVTLFTLTLGFSQHATLSHHNRFVQNNVFMKKADSVEAYKMAGLIADGKIDEVKAKIESYGKDYFGYDVLFSAASENAVEVLAYFKSIGLPLDLTDNNDSSLHFYACRDRGKAQVVAYLLENGVRPETKAIRVACNNGKITILELYQKFGINLKTPEFLEAAVYSGLECVQFLLAQGLSLDPNVLPRAADLGKVELVKHLVLNHKADPNATNIHGFNAVHQACSGRFPDHLNILKFLHSHGGDLRTPTAWGREVYTPLHFACRPGSPEKINLIKYLIENGVDPELNNPKSALSVADTQTRKQILNLLKKMGTKVEKDPFEKSFDIEKMVAFATKAIRLYAEKHSHVTVFRFVIEGPTMSMGDRMHNSKLEYSAFADFREEHGFDDALWDEHYNSAGDESTLYCKAMNEVIKELDKRKAFNCLNRSNDFTAQMIEHEY